MAANVNAVFDFLSSSFVSLFSSLLSGWGFIGLSVVGVWLLARVVRLFRKIIQF